MGELKNIRHEKFCRKYVITGSATKAYKEVYHVKSVKTANVSGARLLAFDSIQKRIEELSQKAAKKFDLSAKKVLEEHMHRAFYDITEVIGDVKSFTLKGVFKALKELPADKRRLVKSVYKTKDGIRIEMVDKDYNLERIGRHFKLYTDVREHKGKVEVDSKEVPKTEAEIKDDIRRLEKALGLKPGEEIK